MELDKVWMELSYADRKIVARLAGLPEDVSVKECPDHMWRADLMTAAEWREIVGFFEGFRTIAKRLLFS